MRFFQPFLKVLKTEFLCIINEEINEVFNIILKNLWKLNFYALYRKVGKFSKDFKFISENL